MAITFIVSAAQTLTCDAGVTLTPATPVDVLLKSKRATKNDVEAKASLSAELQQYIAADETGEALGAALREWAHRLYSTYATSYAAQVEFEAFVKAEMLRDFEVRNPTDATTPDDERKALKETRQATMRKRMQRMRERAAKYAADNKTGFVLFEKTLTTEQQNKADEAQRTREASALEKKISAARDLLIEHGHSTGAVEIPKCADALRAGFARVASDAKLANEFLQWLALTGGNSGTDESAIIQEIPTPEFPAQKKSRSRAKKAA